MAQLVVNKLWHGAPIPADAWAFVELFPASAGLTITVDAPFHNDPPPPGPPGSVDGLWNYEVVELFLLGEGDCYLEVELGPHGHYLVLRLQGVRQVQASGMSLQYTAVVENERWRGVAHLPAGYLPPGLQRANVYRIRGVGEQRQYFAAYPVPGDAPDFHQLECFGPLQYPL